MSLEMNKISNKFFIQTFFILFVISTAILLIASTARTPVPTWGGYLDVGIVVLIAFLGISIHQRNKSFPRFDISYPVVIHLFPLILVGLWIYREALDFNILLPGVAWRTYFFFSILPHCISLWKIDQR
jgi:hypothetical protein